MNSFNELTENVKIYLRIRPNSFNEESNRSSSNCLAIDQQNPEQAVNLFTGSKAEVFTYDCVGGPESGQEDIFEAVAKPVTEYCLQGYNGTVFAYGQTGSGKTFTMQGPMSEDGLIDYNNRGLIPRTFEYLFECIRAEEALEGNEREFLCKCTYVEIYNELIYDLLDMNPSVGCTLREDIKRGVYIEGAREEVISSPSEAYEVYERGSLNRHVAETSMNRESSRSHSVFTLFIQSKQRVGEIIDVRESRFNLVDLAGSERQQATGTTGLRLKEAGNINKSLLALSNVINALVDISHGRPRHVQYRDSKLTFLLRDSLGGNAKTVIIANVSPSSTFYSETLSTLKFAQRAKMIKNKAMVNKDIQGNVLQLQAEIQRLQHELYLSRQNIMDVDNPNDSFSGASAIVSDTKKIRLTSEKSTNSLKTSSKSTNVNELDPAETYLMLTMALERQSECNDELESQRAKLHLLEELVKRKEAQNQSIRMILKFRENSLKSSQPSDGTDISSSTDEDLKREIYELRKIIEHHPEVTRFAYENLQLREKLYKFETFEKKIDDFESQINRHKQYEQLLTDRLLVLERTKAISLASSTCTLEDEEAVPMREISDNSQNENDNIKLKQDVQKEKDDKISNLISETNLLQQKYSEAVERENDFRIQVENLESQVLALSSYNKELIEQIEGLKGKLDKSNVRTEERNETISKQEESIQKLNERISELQREISSLQGLSGVIEAERDSVSKLIQEKEEITLQFDQLTRTLERERDQTRILLQDFERAKEDINVKTLEIQVELEKNRVEMAASVQRVKSAQSEKGLIQQELEVTRQILAEYKARDHSTTTANTEAAAAAGRKIVQLEAQISSLTESLRSAEQTASALTALADRNKILQAENGQLHGKIGKLEFLMRSAQSDNDELMGQVTQLQKHLETQLKAGAGAGSSSTSQTSALEAQVTQNQQQLEAANHTISGLKKQILNFEGEIANLKSENERLSQHHNLKQKLQYHVKIKQENNELQEELQKCREEIVGLRGKQESFQSTLNEIKKYFTADLTSKTNANSDKILNILKSI